MEWKNTLLRRLMAAAVSVCMLLPLAACTKAPAETTVPAEPVTADQAIIQLQEQSEALGFDNALDGLEEKNTASIGGDTYIRLQQHYEGIPVYGKTIVYAANEQGELTSVTGNVQDIDTNIDMTPVITAEQAQERIRDYAADELGIANANEITIEEISGNDLCIYTGTTSAALSFVVSVGTDRVILDAHDGSILSWSSAFSFQNVQYTGPDGTRSIMGTAPISGRYILKDQERNIYVYDAQGKAYYYDGETHPDAISLVTSSDTVFGDDDDNTATSELGYIYLDTLGKVHDFFLETVGDSGPEPLIAVYNDLYKNPNHSDQSKHEKNGGGGYGDLSTDLPGALPDSKLPLSNLSGGMLIMSTGYNEELGTIYDTIGHEYQHIIFKKHIEGGGSALEFCAINEGIADIMGELFQASQEEADWVNDYRDMRNPKSRGHAAAVGDSTANDIYVHSTIISHSAYLMWNGIDGTKSKKLSEQQLAELWYRAVLMMPSDCDFILCRQLVEVAAQSMEDLTDEQRSCVREAFDAVGISTVSEDTEADYHLDVNGTLSVYDENREYYSGYTLSINGNPMRLPVGDRKPEIGFYYNKTVKVDSAEPYQVDLPAGLFLFKISDEYSPVTYSFTVQVGPGSASNIDLITAYEEPLVVVIPEIDYENLVSDAYSDFFTDDYDWEYCFHIPQFNLYGDLARQANQTIYDRCYGILERDAYACMDEYGYSELDGMQYCWGYHGDLASVVIETNSSTAYDPEYAVYTISTATGSAISMDELLIQFGMNREAYYELVYNRLKQYWDDWLVAAESNGNFVANDPFFKSCVTRTLADENIRKTIPYINPTGGLSFVADIYSMAGADSYLHLINAEGKVGADYPECTKDHSKDTAAPTGDALQYFIENCDLVYFTEADIQDFDLEMCLYARNAVFAKSGRKFQNQELQTYFGKYSWYVPCVEPEDFTNDMLNRKQLANVELVQNLERKLKEAQEVENLLATLDGEEGIYTRYLHGGGYEELVGQEVDKNTLEVSSCLIDLDNDGTDELFLSLGTGQSGVRGMETYTFLLDIESGKVVKAVEAYFGGGSMGGDHLGIRYDKDQLRHVLVLEGHTRDGVSAYGTYLDIYSETDFKAGMELFEGYYSLYGDTYRESAANVRAETSLYYEDGEDFRFYQINDAYVTKEAFDSAWARFEEPRDGFQPKAGSFVKPIA